jgi:hypothetical protein
MGDWFRAGGYRTFYKGTGTAKDPFTADETVALLKRLEQDDNEQPWLTVCSFLNPHDISLFGVIALTQGLRYDAGSIPHVPEAPTFKEDLPTKPACQQSYIDAWGEDPRAAAVAG